MYTLAGSQVSSVTSKACAVDIRSLLAAKDESSIPQLSKL